MKGKSVKVQLRDGELWINLEREDGFRVNVPFSLAWQLCESHLVKQSNIARGIEQATSPECS